MNNKTSSQKVAAKAAKILSDDTASRIQRSLAASVVAQASTGKQTGAEMENVASRVLQSPKYSDETKSLAASVLSQSDRSR